MLEAGDRRLHQERQQRHAVAFVARLGVKLLAVALQVGDIRLVVLCDVRDVEPRAVEVRARDPFDARQGPAFDRPESREVLGWNLRYAGRRWTCRGHSRWSRCRAAQERLHVLARDAAFLSSTTDLAEVHLQLARQAANA